MLRILNINLSNKNIYINEFIPSFSLLLSGRGLNSFTVWEMHDIPKDPFSSKNIICIAPGSLSGSGFPGCNRTTITTARSPLTSLFGDGHVGGFFGKNLKWAGYDQVIITGESAHPVYISIDDNFVIIKDAHDFWGRDTGELQKAIESNEGRDCSILSIGSAGEHKSAVSAIIIDGDRAAASTGAAAVLGAKKVKAIAVRGSQKPLPQRKQAFHKISNQLIKDIKNARYYHRWREHGTSFLVDLFDITGTLPTRNFQTGVFPDALSVNSKAFSRHIVSSKGCYSCPVKCHKICEVKFGQYAGTVGKRPEYECIGGFGPMCGISDSAFLIYVNQLVNELGLDVVQTSKAISTAMHWFQDSIITKADTGNLDLSWGNEQSVLEIIRQIAANYGFGAILAGGAMRAADKISDMKNIDSQILKRYVIQTKGMAHSAVELRSSRGIALAYGVASRGGDHLRGHATQERYASYYSSPEDWEKIGVPVEEARLWYEAGALNASQYKAKGYLVKWMEDFFALADSVGLCKFLTPWQNMPCGPEHIAGALSAFTGNSINSNDVMKYGEQISNIEKLVQLRNGVRQENDVLPSRLFEEPLPEGPNKGAVLDRIAYQNMLEEYYKIRGWNKQTGIPAQETLLNLNLK